MKAAVSRTPKAPLVIEDLDLAGPGDGYVQVDIKAVAICHSDLIFIDGGWSDQTPAVYGHEAAGVVSAVGRDTPFAVGDKVLVTLLRGCGECPCCTVGSRSYCTAERFVGVGSPLTDASGASVTQGIATGAFAEGATVHHSQLAKLTGDIGWAEASLLSCGVITGYGAVTNAAQLQAGATAVVIGAGGVGLNAVQGAALSGASKVIVIDISEEKLEISRAFGATDTFLATEEKLDGKIRKLTGGGADYVFVTVGSARAMDSAYSMMAVGGTTVIVGMTPAGHQSSFDPLMLADMSQRVIGSKMGKTVLERDIPALEQSYYDGKLKLDELVTGRFALDEINDAIDLTKRGVGVRNVIIL